MNVKLFSKVDWAIVEVVPGTDYRIAATYGNDYYKWRIGSKDLSATKQELRILRDLLNEILEET